MNLVTSRQIGLKPEPKDGGPNVALLPGQTPVTIDPTWTQVKVTSGPEAGKSGWVHTADLAPAANPVPTPTPTPTPTPGAIVPVGIPGNWSLKFADEFDGATLDTSKWTPNWLGSLTQVTPPVNQSQETACYDPAQVSLSQGSLLLTAERRPQTVNGKQYPFSSGMIQSNGKYNFSYGCFEAKIWTPAGTGMWPAFWTDGQSWPQDGEIDVLEAYGNDTSTFHYHYVGGGPGGQVTVAGATSGWHTYAANWQPGVITWYYDGKEVWSYTQGIVSSSQYLILNLALNSTSAAVPAVMKVDYVRVWQ